MNTILTDDERPELPPTNTVPRDYFTTEQMEAYADAREAAVLAKLARQPPVAHRYRFGDVWMFDTYRWNGQDPDEVVPVYAAPQPAVVQVPPIPLNIIRKWPDGFEARLQHVWKDVISFTPNAKLWDLQRVLAEFGFRMEVYDQTSAPEAPAQASAVDERDRKDAERYRFIRANGRYVVKVSGESLHCGGHLPFNADKFGPAIDKAIDEARAALAQRGGDA
jgi:hypothetical protein